MKKYTSFINESGIKAIAGRAKKQWGTIEYFKLTEILKKCAIGAYKDDIERMLVKMNDCMKDVIIQFKDRKETGDAFGKLPEKLLLSVVETLINLEITYKTPNEKFLLRLTMTHNTVILVDIEEDKIEFNIPKFLKKEVIDSCKWYYNFGTTNKKN